MACALSVCARLPVPVCGYRRRAGNRDPWQTCRPPVDTFPTARRSLCAAARSPASRSFCNLLQSHRRRVTVERREHLPRAGSHRARFRQQCFRVCHMDADPVQLNRRHVPPARNHGGEDHLRNQVAPDQRLLPRRNQEILFGFGQRIGQRRQRPHQPSSGVGGPSGTEHLGLLPGLVRRLDADEVMAANKQRVGMQYLRSGRRVVNVIEAYQRVAQEGSQRAAQLLQFLASFGRFFDGRAQVQLPLASTCLSVQ